MPEISIECAICGKSFQAWPSANRRYCSKKCAGVATSARTSGVPKPHLRGANNPNYGGVYTSRPDVRERLRAGCKRRGQAWTEVQRKAHSLRMTDPTVNWMTGRKHTNQTKQQLSKIYKQYWEDGVYDARCHGHLPTSIAEDEIRRHLEEQYHDLVHQKQFPGISYVYDFFIPNHGAVVEYQGDYWHFNPKKYASGTHVSRPQGRVLVDDVWRRDLVKREAVERLGHQMYYFWESEYLEHGVAYIDIILSEAVT